MLYESDVTDALVKFLEKHDYKILEKKGPTEKGIDITATKDGKTLCIEAKGETSFRENSKRYGKPFNSGQVEHHIARAIFTSLKIIEKIKFQHNHYLQSAIAFPNTPEFTKRIKPVLNTLRMLEITVYLVSANSQVDILE